VQTSTTSRDLLSFLSFFLTSGPPTIPMGSLQLSFPPWLKPVVTPLGITHHNLQVSTKTEVLNTCQMLATE